MAYIVRKLAFFDSSRRNNLENQLAASSNYNGLWNTWNRPISIIKEHHC